MKRRKMSALQRKYFGKHHKTVALAVHHKKRVVHTAKRRSYRSKSRSYGRKGMGGLKSLIVPIGAGYAENIIDGIIPIAGVAPTVAGMFLHNEILKTMGLYQIGYSLGNLIPLPGIGGARTGALL